MKTKSQYTGVTEWRRNKALPWRAQITAGSKSYYLGAFGDETEAAEAYDNAAYYLNNAGCGRQRKLNFPEAYAHQSVPPPTERTLRMLADFGAEVKLGPTAKRLNASTLEGLRKMVDSLHIKFTTSREALKAAVGVHEGILTEIEDCRVTLALVDICPLCSRACNKTGDNYSDCCGAQMER